MNDKRPNPFLNSIYTVSFLGLISSGFFASIETANMASVKLETISHLIDGKIAEAIEDSYDKNFPVKQLGVNFWSAIDYHFFLEGKPGVVIGDDNWLFTEEEFVATSQSETSLRENLSFIHWADKQLRSNGIQVVVSLVPAKARVMADKLLDRQPVSVHQSLYPALLAFCKLYGIPVVDGLQAMQDNSLSAALFFRYDTHWTPEGANLVAAKTAELINQRTSALQLVRQEFITESSQVSEHKGDLLNFLPLSPWFEGLMPAPEFFKPSHTYIDANESALFGETEPDGNLSSATVDVALVGTSYSANHTWNFSGALKQHLATEVANFSSEGEGPMAPMLRFIQQQDFTGVKLVVWEIPERYMLFDYTEHYATIDTQEKPDHLKDQPVQEVALVSTDTPVFPIAINN
jgi:alginate O-acetyltransferase complex protein AlgJ